MGIEPISAAAGGADQVQKRVALQLMPPPPGARIEERREQKEKNT
jgi:hypothetical protein